MPSTCGEITSIDRRGVAVSCSTHTLRVGIEAIVHLLPAQRFDPWIGYGIGLESSTVTAETNKAFATSSLSGLELAHLMAGMDVRMTHYFGFGPFADVAIGRYTSLQEDATLTRPATDNDIPHPAAHLWVSLGVRAVVFP